MSQRPRTTLSEQTIESNLTGLSNTDGVTSKKKARRLLSNWLASGLCTKEETAVIIAIKKKSRREQLRIGQARYRQKHRKIEQQEQQNVQRLREEIQMLKLKHESIRCQSVTTPSPWNIVSKVFHLIETCFRSPSCVTSVEEMKKNIDIRRSLRYLTSVITSDVAMGELHGFDPLLAQVRCYPLYFGHPNLELNQVEMVAPSIMSATATLSLTINELTLERVFPHLKKLNTSYGGIEHKSLCRRLVGQRLNCSCTMTFLFNEENQHLERLEVSMGLLPSLVQALGDMEVGLFVYEGALVSSECTWEV
ncbi:hypothetical protein BBO99_00004459 [Phytophthora kernoviae]|uniref:BZIP domain-containing protein n=1 Tax=Phytophthora kernoviae TaxID=325452 RepID=A0A3R7GAH5_9STRA|nr:hypothetical protein JM16_005075 [Phytophthora kernoviae]RLN44676.1 hypothetical protein BBI17_005069 [Phytophthora kernoviae]RLN80483.1 hypothetical protein BBO99_00004459 [Phytophthora kernoviae]